jgi:hypothetical protein
MKPRAGSSAKMRHSIAQPRIVTWSCVKGSGLSGAMRICSFTRSRPGHHLRDRMLDLQPRVHLHEVELAARVAQELARARAHVAGRARRTHAELSEPRARRRVHDRGRATPR